MKRRTKKLIPVLVLAVLIAAGLILSALKHAQIDANVPVGEDVMLSSQGTP